MDARFLTRRALDGTLFDWLEEKGLTGDLGGWMERAAPLRGQKVVQFHKTWVYLSKLLGFQIVGSIEPKPGIKPGPKHLQSLRDLMESQGVRLLIVENYQDPSDPNALAAATGAKVVIVPTQPGGEAGTDDYFQLMDYVIDRLVEAVNP
ncbi:MAG: zinc ABC transporter substrate-binding protein [Acidobacteria bacterium]|nr:zinc ABC transporter substrate-binding protein [Acidobacteriota bacterium]